MEFFRQEPIRISSKDFSATEVIEALKPQLTDERWRRLESVVAHRTDQIVPVLENIYDRGNISAVMRSAEAFGFYHFHVIERPDAKFKAANRVTQGTDKWLDVVKSPESWRSMQMLKESGYKIYATHLDATVSIDEIDFHQPTAVVFGNEKDGVSEDILAACDGRFVLPMHGFAQSFNISVAAALTFYHIYRCRKATSMSKEKQQMLMANYLLRSVASAEKILCR